MREGVFFVCSLFPIFLPSALCIRPVYSCVLLALINAFSYLLKKKKNSHFLSVCVYAHALSYMVI